MACEAATTHQRGEAASEVPGCVPQGELASQRGDHGVAISPRSLSVL